MHRSTNSKMAHGALQQKQAKAQETQQRKPEADRHSREGQKWSDASRDRLQRPTETDRDSQRRTEANRDSQTQPETAKDSQKQTEDSERWTEQT